jgi:hypothetical protein
MKKLFWTILMAVLLSACGMMSTRDNPSPTNTAVAVPYKIVKLTAIGYGNMGAFEGYTPGQKRLMAMRAAKLDAYRALAEQVYGVRVTGNSTVAAMVSQNDSFRVHVDACVRGATVASITPMAENNYETILELELGSDFFEYFKKRTNSQALASVSPDSAISSTVGKVGPGEAYSSNFTYYSE